MLRSPVWSPLLLKKFLARHRCHQRYRMCRSTWYQTDTIIQSIRSSEGRQLIQIEARHFEIDKFCSSSSFSRRELSFWISGSGGVDYTAPCVLIRTLCIFQILIGFCIFHFPFSQQCSERFRREFFGVLNSSGRSSLRLLVNWRFHKSTQTLSP